MQSEKEYQDWMKKFYTGNFLIKGWNGRKQEVLAAIKDRKEETGALLDELGEIIVKEWAKDNDIRRIGTDDLRRWGGEMTDAARRSADDVIKILQEIKEEALGKLGDSDDR